MSLGHVCPRCEDLEQAITANDEEIQRMAARIAELERENFSLAADQCHHGYGNEGGSHRCKYQDEIADLTMRVKELGAMELPFQVRDRLTTRIAELEAALREIDALHVDRENGLQELMSKARGLAIAALRGKEHQ